MESKSTEIKLTTNVEGCLISYGNKRIQLPHGYFSNLDIDNLKQTLQTELDKFNQLSYQFIMDTIKQLRG